MSLAFHQVDAFSDRPFAGNPAMVYRLDQWLDEALMQRIAAEHPGARILICGSLYLAGQVLRENG